MSYPGVYPAWPYLKTISVVAGHLSLFAKDPQEMVGDPKTLQNVTIASVEGTDIQKIEIFKQHNQIVFVNSFEDGIGMLIDGQADFVLEFAEIFKYHLRKSQQTDIKEVYTWPKPTKGGLLVRNDYPLLHSILNKALADISQYEMPKILDKWYQWGMSGRPEIKLTLEEKAWLANHPVIRVGESSQHPPLLIQREDGKLEGVVVLWRV